MEIRNMTPHAVTLSGMPSVTWEPDPEGPARLIEVQKEETTDEFPIPQENFKESIPVVDMPVYCGVKGLPDPKEGVLYIVSQMVLASPLLEGRHDVIAPDTGPGSAVRDNKGIIIGVCRFLRRPQSPVSKVSENGIK